MLGRTLRYCSANRNIFAKKTRILARAFSSAPFTQAKALDLQGKCSSAIPSRSSVYKDDGDYSNFANETAILAQALSSARSSAPLAEAEVLELQQEWASAITSISSVYKDGGDYIKAAADAAGQLYGYGHSQVLFKPTRAAAHPFRPTGNEAMSYFVGGNAVEGGYDEDGGFAINGGNGWSNVKFNNHGIDLNGPVAIAMGTYEFTCATTGDVTKVEYTFGYKRNDDGKARIFLHHSSVPFGT